MGHWAIVTRRRRLALCAAVGLPALLVAGLLWASGAWSAGLSGSPTPHLIARPAGCVGAGASALPGSASPGRALPGSALRRALRGSATVAVVPSPCPPPSVVAVAPPTLVPAPAARHRRHALKRSSRRSPPSPAVPLGTPAGGQSSAAALQVLALINQVRGQHGLSAYTLTTGLDASAAAHNTRMASGCGLSHQCPGEPAIGARETAAGVHWTVAGENIGDGGPVPAGSSSIAQMALALTKAMLAEQPPDDGHRRNILSTAFRHIGIAVYRDSAGTVWLTQDFSD
jgi:uncharacterized protein YkwD